MNSSKIYCNMQTDANRPIGRVRKLHRTCVDVSTSMCLYLFNRGANIDAIDHCVRTSIAVQTSRWTGAACRKGHKDISLALIDRGADIAARDEFGRTCAHLCSPDALPRVYGRTAHL